ncbi:hypothetical protein [Halomonas sp. GT]|uniref:hypothetical protein n=1 Tax=Halomonas sp. GT TaxID=1971364 RepID=UPI0009F4B76A|nr:hypothetical protein [Halomonas sp. GT]
MTGENLLQQHKTVLVWFLAIFPFAVLGAFTWLVSRHHTKLYSPSDFRNDDGFIRILSPEEQKKRIKSGVREIREAEQKLSEKPQEEPPARRNSEIVRSIILAEELAFRELESIYGVSINRHVSIGAGYDTGIDGMFVSENRAYIVEIKYVKHKINFASFEKGLLGMANKLKNFNRKNFNIIFSVVLENEQLLTKEQMGQMMERFTQFGSEIGVKVLPKVFLLKELKEKFGYEENR